MHYFRADAFANWVVLSLNSIGLIRRVAWTESTPRIIY